MREKNYISDDYYFTIFNGTITTSDGAIHKTPSGAAKHLNGNKPVDGWHTWKIKSSGVRLSELRENFSS